MDAGTAIDGQSISVVLSTRNRSSVIARAVQAILENVHPNFEVIVLDQSDNDLTRIALDPLLSDSRLRYLHSAGRGRSAGLNEGIREASGALLLTTDDDCKVSRDWVRTFEEAFAIDSRVGVVFGNVLPAPHDRARGCVPSYVRQTPFLARSIRDKPWTEGIGACMGMRRSVWQSLGGFDEMLGAGARFHAGEDVDLSFRALLAGFWIYEVPAVRVEHHGLREWPQLPSLINCYWQGTGAMFAKAIRTCLWPVLLLLIRLAARWALGRSTIGDSLGHRPARFRKLVAFLRGFFAGLACRVDKPTGCYVGQGKVESSDFE